MLAIDFYVVVGDATHRLAERFVALRTGRVIADGAPGVVLDDPEVAGAFLGNTTRERPDMPPGRTRPAVRLQSV